MSTAFDKNLKVSFPGSGLLVSGEIQYKRGRGPRIDFKSRRTMRAEPDTATISIWNMPGELSKALANSTSELRARILEAQAIPGLKDEVRVQIIKEVVSEYQIEVCIGWGDECSLVFRGDPISVRPDLREGRDLVTEIDIGDAFAVLENTQMLNQLAPGETPASLISWVLALVDASRSRKQLEAQVGAIAPNAQITKMKNGFVAKGRAVDTLRTLGDLYATNFWVKDGSVHMVDRESVLKDFAVVLDERENLLDLSEQNPRGERIYNAIASPNIHPGRGVVVNRIDGSTFKGRIVASEMDLSTHEDPWFVQGILEALSFSEAAVVKG